MGASVSIFLFFYNGKVTMVLLLQLFQMMGSEPTSLQAYSQDDQDGKVDIDKIIEKSKLEESRPQKVIRKLSGEHDEVKEAEHIDDEQKQLDEVELEMLVEECEQLISKISPNFSNFSPQQEPTVISDADESFSMKREKNRLQKEYIELCLQIQRQQKELQNYRFKVQVAQKQAEYYTRQIKQKTAILQNLQQHSTNCKKGRQSFRK